MPNQYTTGRAKATPPETRFWALVEKTDECWLWKGTTDGKGYGFFRLTGKKTPGAHMARAHRLSYEWVNGPVPEGLQLDHLCRTKRCVRPDHLEAVTGYENMQRQKKTHCKRGHPLDGVGLNRCRVCHREQGAINMRRYRAARREALLHS